MATVRLPWDHEGMIWKWIGQVAEGVLVLSLALALGLVGLASFAIATTAVPALRHLGEVPLAFGLAISTVLGMSLAVLIFAGCRASVDRLARGNRNRRILG